MKIKGIINAIINESLITKGRENININFNMSLIAIIVKSFLE